MSTAAAHHFATQRASRAAARAKAALSIEAQHTSKAALAGLIELAKAEPKPGAAMLIHGLPMRYSTPPACMTDQQIQALASFLAGTLDILTKKYEETQAGGYCDTAEAIALERAKDATEKRIKRLARFLGIKHWPALTTPGCSVAAILRAEELLLRWTAQDAGKDPAELEKAHGPTPGFDAAGHYGFTGGNLLRVFKAARCTVGARFDALLRRAYENGKCKGKSPEGFAARAQLWAYKSGFSLRKIALIQRGASAIHRGRASSQALYALGRMSRIAALAAASGAKPDQPGKPIRLRNLNWAAAKEAIAAQAAIKAGTASIEQKKLVFSLLSGREARINFAMKHFHMQQSSRDGVISMESEVLWTIHGVDLRLYIHAKCTWRAAYYRDIDILATRGPDSYHADNASTREAVSRAIAAWKKQRKAKIAAGEERRKAHAISELEASIAEGNVFCPIIYRKDSFAAGNCEPGTEAFAVKHGWGDKAFIPAQWLRNSTELRARNTYNVAVKESARLITEQ